jgi:hypothetical protein
LAGVYAAERERPFAVGSVKTNVGHLESAAGVISLIKLMLCLEAEELAPHLNLKTVNPHIDVDGLGVGIVGGHVARFVDVICVTNLHIRWPLPWPAPPWFADTLTGADLIVMGTQFQQSAAMAMDRDLGRTFADAAHALLEAGAARLV